MVEHQEAGAQVFAGIAVTLASPATEFKATHGGELYRHKIMRVGRWVQAGDPVTLTPEDLRQIVENFDKFCRKDMLVVDYEHSSLHPERGQGGPVPAAGWIHELATDGEWLTATIEWTQQARDLIRSGAYRFCSPAWSENGRDLTTGANIGVRLNSLALTNQPQMEELPPIRLSAIGGEQLALASAAHAAGADGKTGLDGAVKSPSAATGGEGDTAMSKQMTLRPIASGDLAGHHGVMDGDSQVGHITDHHLGSYTKQFCHSMTAAALAELGLVKLADLGSDVKEASAVKALIDLGRGAEKAKQDAEARTHLFSAFTAPDSKIPGAVILNEASAMTLAREGKITTVDFIAASSAQKLLDGAVQSGRILPRERGYFLRDAIDRPTEFAAMLKDRPVVVSERAVGNGGGAPVSVMQELRTETERVIKEMSAADPKFASKGKQLQTVEARKRLFRENPALKQAYDEERNSRRPSPAPKD